MRLWRFVFRDEFLGLKSPGFSGARRNHIRNSDFQRLLGLACGSGVRDQPAPDAFGDLACRYFWHHGRVPAFPADPVPPTYLLAEEFDAVRRLTSLLQTDADVNALDQRRGSPEGRCKCYRAFTDA